MRGLECAATRDAQGARFGGVRRSAPPVRPLAGRGCRTVPVAPAAARSRWGWLAASGKTLAGFSSHCGSNRSLTCIWIARSSGSYCVPIRSLFFDADAMFAGQAAADLDAKAQDIGAERLGLSRSPGLLALNRISGCILPSPA